MNHRTQAAGTSVRRTSSANNDALRSSQPPGVRNMVAKATSVAVLRRHYNPLGDLVTHR